MQEIRISKVNGEWSVVNEHTPQYSQFTAHHYKTIVMTFKNKVAIVTGAGQGIGFEICSNLAQEGAHVILNDIDQTLADNAVKKIMENGGVYCISLGGDSGDTAFIEKIVDTAVVQFGQLDIAIANAG